ncbi:hypothetical protein COLO4_35616 [Corchorus olitorius]|uniref:RNase H type-1 domain-containing protein n=1 Tax=Corchorus olitorius TaxID=93759 RepID=A0A1R3GEN7_9ROSI|nr:hypothetical protein COLO4_35616 [Corchorus olitorius]
MSGRRVPLSPESGIRGSVQQSVGGTRGFTNHVDSLLINNRAVRRSIFGRENNGEVSSRVPREEGSSPILHHGGGSSRVVQDQTLLCMNNGGTLHGLKQTTVFSIGRNPEGVTRRMRSLPARSGDPRYNFPGRYWKPVVVEDEGSCEKGGNVARGERNMGEDDSVTGFTEIYGTHRSPHKGKAVMGAVEKHGVRERGLVEGVGDSEDKNDHNWVEAGKGNSVGSSAHIILGVGLAKKGPNGNSPRETQCVNLLLDGSKNTRRENDIINGPGLNREGMDFNKGQEQKGDVAPVAVEAFVFGAKFVSSYRRPPRKWKTAARMVDKYSFEALLQQQMEVGKKRGLAGEGSKMVKRSRENEIVMIDVCKGGIAKEVADDAWNNSHGTNVVSKIDNCKVRLKQWDWESFGNIRNKIVLKKVEREQLYDMAQSGGESRDLYQCQEDLNALYGYEEVLWKKDRRNIRGSQIAVNRERVAVVRWIPPSEVVLKINMDASFLEDRHRAGLGAVIRDSRGLVLCCAVRQYNFVQDCLVAEMQLIRFGLQLAKDEGHQNCVLESDCLVAINTIRERSGQL